MQSSTSQSCKLHSGKKAGAERMWEDGRGQSMLMTLDFMLRCIMISWMKFNLGRCVMIICVIWLQSGELMEVRVNSIA